MISFSTTNPGSRSAGRGRSLLVLAIVQALAGAAAAQAQDVCKPEFRAGSQVWYVAVTVPRVARSSDSGCTVIGGAGASVRFTMRGSQEVIFCDRDLPLPEAMRAALADAARRVPTELPSLRRGRAATWEALIREHSRELVCAPGFLRTSDARSDVPSVWCQKRMTARELCPLPGSTFTDGSCYSMVCPEGTADLDRPSGGRLGGCSRCPAGSVDVKESLAWQAPSTWASSGHAPVTTILCKAGAADPCRGGEATASGTPSAGEANAVLRRR